MTEPAIKPVDANKIFLKANQGKDLAPKDSNGKSDPYLVILYGDQRFKSKCIKKTLNPVWTDQHFIIEGDPSVTQILVECWDYDKVGKHDFMGEFYIDVSEIPDDGTIETKDFTLKVCNDPKNKDKNTSNVSGTIELELHQTRRVVKKKKDSLNSSKNPITSSKSVKGDSTKKDSLNSSKDPITSAKSVKRDSTKKDSLNSSKDPITSSKSVKGDSTKKDSLNSSKDPITSAKPVKRDSTKKDSLNSSKDPITSSKSVKGDSPKKDSTNSSTDSITTSKSVKGDSAKKSKISVVGPLEHTSSSIVQHQRNFDQQTEEHLHKIRKKLSVVPLGNGTYKVFDKTDPNSQVVILDEVSLTELFPKANLNYVNATLQCETNGDVCPAGMNYNQFLSLLQGTVDKKWNPPQPKCFDKPDDPWLKNLAKKFRPGSPPFHVPKNVTPSNATVGLLENLANFTIVSKPRVQVNQQLAQYAIKLDQAWCKIPLPLPATVLNQESITIKFFIDEMGITSLVSDKANLKADFGDDLQVTFTRKDKKNKVWTPDNTEIVEKNKDDSWHIRLRSEAFNLVTIRDHLCLCHLTYSNYLYQAVAKLHDKDKIIYRLLRPHILGSNEKNSDAYWNLYNCKGILLAGIAEIDNRPYVIAEFENSRRDWLNNLQTFPEWRANNKAFHHTKFVQRGIFVYEKIQAYVSGYFNDNGINDSTFDDSYIGFWGAIQEMLGQSSIPLNRAAVERWLVEIIWRVSYFHYQVGNVLPYLYDCDKIHWDRCPQSSDGSLWSLVVGFATSSRQYQLINFPYLEDPVMKVWYKPMVDALISYKDEFGDEKIDGNPQWVWELEPSVAR